MCLYLSGRALFWHHRPRPDAEAGQHLSLHLPEDPGLSVPLRTPEGEQGSGGPAVRLRGGFLTAHTHTRSFIFPQQPGGSGFANGISASGVLQEGGPNASL